MKTATYQVNIENVVKHYDFGNENGFLFCLFETVSNALYCSSDNKEIKITIKITREYKANELTNVDEDVITSVSVSDNGIGFTDKNFKNFTRSIYETNHDCGKGLGRISYLKVFNNVLIESKFEENGITYSRNFKFDLSSIKDTKKKIEDNNKLGTTIHLRNIKGDYRNDSKKKIEYLTDQILNHFYTHLYYLLEKKKKFEIKIIDDSGKIAESVINNAKLKNDKITRDSFKITDSASFDGLGTVTFDILHIKTLNVKGNKAFYVVDERSAGEIPKLNLPPCVLKDETGTIFNYFVYLKSGFFNSYLNESRTKLSIPTENRNPQKRFFTEERIIDHLQKKIDSFLEYELNILEKETENKINNTLSRDNNNLITNNKSYLYILADDETKKELLKKIKFNDTEKDVISKIRNFHEELQTKTIEQINVMVEKLKTDKKTENTDIDYEKLETELQSLLQKVNIENSVNLSSYIMYRKYVLDLFYEGLEYYKKSKEYNEAFFHNLLMPKKSHNTIDSNLWMLDDLFLYFEGISEIPILDIEIGGQKIIRNLNEEETEMLKEFDKKRLERRIDLLFFPAEKQCIIIELKDPKADMVYGVTQMDRYAKQLANFIKPEFSIDQFYTYLITDNFNKYDTPSQGYRKIYGIDGFVRHSIEIGSFDNNRTIANQYSEVIRYTDIYERAKNRNKIFFQKLNINDETKANKRP
jgi:hypothetical protein